MNKITCICLGVRNMEKALKFYRDGLGYKTDCKEDNPPVCFFNTPGTKFELFPLDSLAKDIDENNPPTGTGFSGITFQIADFLNLLFLTIICLYCSFRAVCKSGFFT